MSDSGELSPQDIEDLQSFRRLRNYPKYDDWEVNYQSLYDRHLNECITMYADFVYKEFGEQMSFELIKERFTFREMIATLSTHKLLKTVYAPEQPKPEYVPKTVISDAW